jgi:hypothetical protein
MHVPGMSATKSKSARMAPCRAAAAGDDEGPHQVRCGPAAATDQPMPLSTASPWSGCSTTGAPASTSPAAPHGLQKKDITRCRKRYIAREVYKALTCANITRLDLVQAA